jgi:glycolate oxidase
MLDAQVKDALIQIVGQQSYTDNLIDMVSYSYDASEHRARPSCAVWVETTAQVSEVMKLANREKIPVIPRGAGTGLSGLTVPVHAGIVMDLMRMNKILELRIEDRLVVVQPGLVYADLEKALASHGFFFPPDPSSGKVCTMGGTVGTNAGGVKGAKYGTTRDYVLGLEIVLADGRVMRTGGKTIKNVSGYDLTRLFVASEGTLGIVTEIALKINPKPTCTTTAMATFNDLEDAGRAVSEVMQSGILPSVLEILGRETIVAINQNTDLKLPEVDALLLAETDGYTQGETDFQMEKVLEVFRRNKPGMVNLATSQEEAVQLWKARKSAYAVLARIKTHFVLEDVTVPIGKVPALLKGIQAIAKKHEIQIATFGHAGDGNLHPQILYNGYDPAQVRKMEAASDELFRLAIELEGTLTGEHGIGISKAKFMTLEHDAVELEMMRTVKRAFDPNNILNPGKMGLDTTSERFGSGGSGGGSPPHHSGARIHFGRRV